MTGRVHETAHHSRTAHDIEEIHLLLRDYPDDMLRQIPVLAEGAHLQEGATYLDLRDAMRCPFTATSDMKADANHYYVPKADIAYPIWNRLIGVLDPTRTG